MAIKLCGYRNYGYSIQLEDGRHIEVATIDEAMEMAKNQEGDD